MKHTVETASGGMIYTPRSMKIGSGIQNLLHYGGYTDTQQGDLKSLLVFFKIRDVC
jgi:hypothetical protein